VKKLIFIGDSLIAFYDWKRRFSGYLVINMGISGETVDGLYSRLGRVFIEKVIPDYIFIMTGINNLAMDDNNFIQTYRQIINSFLNKYPSSKIFIHSLLPVLNPWISNDKIKMTNVEIQTLADEEEVSYVDIFSKFLDPGGRPIKSYFLDDGVHISEDGYRVWSRTVDKLLSGLV
jgi:lysophospholipase L1-like esterase